MTSSLSGQKPPPSKLPSEPKHRNLYSKNDPTKCAYLLENTNLTVTFEHAPLLELKEKTVLVGLLEYLLVVNAPDQTPSDLPVRLFSVGIDSNNTPRELPFESVDQLFSNYTSGFAANLFLTLLIDHTNRSYIKKVRSLPKDWLDYESIAKQMAQQVHGLNRAADITRIKEIEMLATVGRRLDLYRDGELLLREQALARYLFDSQPMLKYVQKFEKDAFICRQGDPGDSVYILLEGVVGVLVKGKYIAKISEKGEAFGELSLFLGSDRTADLVTESPTTLYRIRRSQLPEFHQSHPNTFFSIARTLAGRVQANLEKLAFLGQFTDESGRPRAELNTKIKEARNQLRDFEKQIRELKKLPGAQEIGQFF